jgi:hypothetical protein
VILDGEVAVFDEALILADLGVRVGRCCPPPGQGNHARFVFWPVVERCRIEVGAVRPNQRVNLPVELDRVELGEITQRTVKFSLEDWPKIDHPDKSSLARQRRSV